jgi:AcrR family transcriptional regulator
MRRPSGRAAVMKAVLDNATRLFAARGFGGVSLRQVAAASGISHTLIHRYFRTKEELVRAVIEEAGRKIAAGVVMLPAVRGHVDQLFAVALAQETEFRLLASAVLLTDDVRALRQGPYPGARALLERLVAETSPRSDVDPRVAGAAIQAFVAGWVVFGEHAMAGSRLPRAQRARVHRQLVQLLEALTLRALEGAPGARRAAARRRRRRG